MSSTPRSRTGERADRSDDSPRRSPGERTLSATSSVSSTTGRNSLEILRENRRLREQKQLTRERRDVRAAELRAFTRRTPRSAARASPGKNDGATSAAIAAAGAAVASATVSGRHSAAQLESVAVVETDARTLVANMLLDVRKRRRDSSSGQE